MVSAMIATLIVVSIVVSVSTLLGLVPVSLLLLFKSVLGLLFQFELFREIV